MPVSMSLVEPAADELAAIAQLRYDAFFEGSDRSLEQDRSELETFVRNQGHEVALVAESDGRLAGACLFVRNEIEPQHDVSPWLAGLVVAPEFRGRGVGSMLVEAIEAHARSVDCPVIHLYTSGAEGFYAALGWSVVERFQDCGASAVLMSKNLSVAG